MCSNQIVHRDDYTSFSVLGLSVILGVGCVIILVSFVLERVVDLLQRDTQKNRDLTQTWTELGLLQLLRKVLETSNSVVWQGEGDVPIALSEGLLDMPLRSSPRLPRKDEQEDPLIYKSPHVGIELVNAAQSGPRND